METTQTKIIHRSEVRSLLGIEDCIEAVENAFKLRALGQASAPGILGTHTPRGGFHTKTGILDLGTKYFVSKTNANFPDNKKLNGLPTIQGIVIVSNADNGRLLAVMDSMELTIIRTGAATAVAAKYLSKKNSSVALICGCGNQGRISLKALLKVRELKKVYAYDIDLATARAFADELARETEVNLVAVSDFVPVAKQADIIVTCTTSKLHFLKKGHVSPGVFIAAVGSDSDDKQELEPALLKCSQVVADSLDQCCSIGELHHAIEQGQMKRSDAHGELGEIIAGLKKGRLSDNEIFIFDSTGIALQDVAAAAIVYEKVNEKNLGLTVNFGD
jgi:alanine dehydrogenase